MTSETSSINLPIDFIEPLHLRSTTDRYFILCLLVHVGANVRIRWICFGVAEDLLGGVFDRCIVWIGHRPFDLIFGDLKTLDREESVGVMLTSVVCTCASASYFDDKHL